MSRRTFLGGCVIAAAAAAVAGCYTGGSVSTRESSGGAGGTSTTSDGTEPAAGAISGLPCAVAKILATRCADCHGSKPKGGATNRMMTHDDLMEISATDGQTRVAEMALLRVKTQSASLTMPPGEALAANEIRTLEAWVKAGSPKGECADITGADSVYDTPTVCSSGKRWTEKDKGSPFMRPGSACISCHDRDDGPSYSVAGTVYATAHEPNDCNGHASSSPMQVVITDAKGVTYSATVNAAGNFFFAQGTSPIEIPLRAKVVANGKTSAMKEPVMHGDCNKCHTETGVEKAPGRIMAP